MEAKMTHKEAALDAIRQIAYDYRHVDIHRRYCTSQTCPLCRLYRLRQQGECYGCPQEDIYDAGTPGCIGQPGYKAVLGELNDIGLPLPGFDRQVFMRRAAEMDDLLTKCSAWEEEDFIANNKK